MKKKQGQSVHNTELEKQDRHRDKDTQRQISQQTHRQTDEQTKKKQKNIFTKRHTGD